MPAWLWWVIGGCGGATLLVGVSVWLARRYNLRLLGPLFPYELVRVARRGAHLPWRIGLVGVLLVGLFVTYLRTFGGEDLLDALAGGATLDQTSQAAFAETFLAVFFAALMLAVVALTPVYAAGAITEEADRGSLDFLLTTGLSSWHIVAGKLAARLSFVLSVILAGLPVLALTLLFGGVDPSRVLAAFALAVGTMLQLGGIAVAFAAGGGNLRQVAFRTYLVLLGLTAVAAVVGRFAPGLHVFSPINVTVLLVVNWQSNSPTDPTWLVVGVATGLQCVLFAGCLTLAVMNLRREVKRERPPPVVEHAPPVAVVSEVPPVEPNFEPWVDPAAMARFEQAIKVQGYDVPSLTDADDPLVWKERHFAKDQLLDDRRFQTFSTIAWSALVAIVAFCALVATLFMAAENSGVRVGQFVEVLAISAAVFLTVALVAGALRLGIRLASAISTERQKQTLPALLLLPGDREEILRAKLVQVLDRQTIYLVAVGVAALLLVLCSPNHAGAIAVVWQFFTALALAAILGLWLSVRCDTGLRATVSFLLIAAGVAAAPIGIGAVLDAVLGAKGELANAVDCLSPVIGIWKSPRATAFGEPLFSFLGGAISLLAAGLLWRSVVRRFEAEGRE